MNQLTAIKYVGLLAGAAVVLSACTYQNKTYLAPGSDQNGQTESGANLMVSPTPAVSPTTSQGDVDSDLKAMDASVKSVNSTDFSGGLSDKELGL